MPVFPVNVDHVLPYLVAGVIEFCHFMVLSATMFPVLVDDILMSYAA
jgi:hypothetical protein